MTNKIWMNFVKTDDKSACAFDWILDVTDLVKEMLGPSVQKAEIFGTDSSYLITEQKLREKLEKELELMRRDMELDQVLMLRAVDAGAEEIKIRFENGLKFSVWMNGAGGLDIEKGIED